MHTLYSLASLRNLYTLEKCAHAPHMKVCMELLTR